MSRLKDLYNEQIVDAMTKKFGYKNVMEVPKLSKIVINMGVGEAKENKKVLESAVADLEKIADYIVFIHEGKVVFSKPKDELTEQYGIIKCGAAQFDALDKSDIIVYRKMDYEWQVLISDRTAMQKKYPKAMIVPATIDEIMLLYVNCLLYTSPSPRDTR